MAHEPHRPDETGVDSDREHGVDEEEPGADRRASLVIVAVLLVALVGALVWVLVSNDDEDPAATTTSAPTTTETPDLSDSEPTESQPPASEPAEEPFDPTLSDEEAATAMWPDPRSSRRFDDPVALARAFGDELLGFEDPDPGPLLEGDSRSGEVELRPSADGPVTTVIVRQLGDDTWWVLGAESDAIELRPVTTMTRDVSDGDGERSTATSVQIEGRARAFEGTVEVLVVSDGSIEPVGTAELAAGVSGEFSHFRGEVDVPGELTGYGAVVVRTVDAASSQVLAASAARLAFTGS